MKTIVIILFAFLTALPVFAANDQPSEASVRALLSITNSQKLLESSFSQIDSMMKLQLRQGFAEEKISPEQRKIIEDARTKMLAVFKEEMKWETFEPMFIDIYTKSFSQQEIDGMLDFYKSAPGQAVLAKMPLVMENSIKEMQRRLTVIIPALQKIQEDAIVQLKMTKKNNITN